MWGVSGLRSPMRISESPECLCPPGRDRFARLRPDRFEDGGPKPGIHPLDTILAGALAQRSTEASNRRNSYGAKLLPGMRLAYCYEE